MRIRFFPVFFLITFFNLTSYSQPGFQKIFTNPLHGGAKSIDQTFDGGYILTGIPETALLKLDSVFNPQWMKSYLLPNGEQGTFGCQAKDSGFILLSENSQSRISLVKTDSTGAVQWSKTYSGISGSYLNIITADDNGYILISRVGARIIKIDSSGNPQWNRVFYSGFSHPMATDLAKTSDGYLVAGQLNYGPGLVGTFIAKVSTTGSVIWKRVIEIPGIDLVTSIEETSDGGCVFGGSNETSGPDLAFVIKTDSSGFPQWGKNYMRGNLTDIFDITTNPDGSIISAGGAFWPQGSYCALVVKFDAAGDTLWSRTYTTDYSQIFDVLKNSNDDILLAGYFLLSGNTEMGLIKIEANGNSSCMNFNLPTIVSTPAIQTLSTTVTEDTAMTGITVQSITPLVTSLQVTVVDPCVVSVAENEIHRLIVQPNPFKSTFQISGFAGTEYEIRIISLTGEVIFNKTGKNFSTESIDLSFAADGFYIVEFHTGKEYLTAKIIKQ